MQFASTLDEGGSASIEDDSAKVDSVLVFEVNGVVKHRFCSEAEGRIHLDKALENFSGGALLTLNSAFGAEVVMDLFQGVRDRVNEQKEKLKNDIRFRDALDKHGVPRDSALRVSISRAFDELGGYH